MTITLNAMPNNGAKTTDIIRLLVLFLNMSTNNARTENLIINNAKPTMTGLVKNLDTPKLVLPVRNFIKTPDVALMILLTGLVAHLPDVRVIPLPLILLTVPTVRTDANIPVIIPAIWTARPARQPPTRAAAAAQPETAAELIPALTVAAVPEPVVLPVLTRNRKKILAITPVYLAPTAVRLMIPAENVLLANLLRPKMMRRMRMSIPAPAYPARPASAALMAAQVIPARQAAARPYALRVNPIRIAM